MSTTEIAIAEIIIPISFDEEKWKRAVCQRVKVYNALMRVEVIPKVTFEEFRQFPVDGKRYELVRGEVHVTPAPATRHQAIVQNLAISLEPHVIKNKLGEVYTAPLDVRLSKDTAPQPDLIFIPNARASAWI